MKLPKLTTRPSRTCTHLVCVPGRQAMPSKPGSAASSPAIWVSSPRITSAGFSCFNPGRIRTERRASATGGRAKATGTGGQGTVA